MKTSLALSLLLAAAAATGSPASESASAGAGADAAATDAGVHPDDSLPPFLVNDPAEGASASSSSSSSSTTPKRRNLQPYEAYDWYPRKNPYARRPTKGSPLSDEQDLADRYVRFGRCVALNLTAMDAPPFVGEGGWTRPPRPVVKSFVEFHFCPTTLSVSSPSSSASTHASSVIAVPGVICDDCVETCDALVRDENNNNNNKSEEEFEDECFKCVDALCANVSEEYADVMVTSTSRSCIRRIVPLSDYVSSSAEHFALEQQKVCERCQAECNEMEDEEGEDEEDAAYGCEEVECPDECEGDIDPDMPDDEIVKLKEMCEEICGEVRCDTMTERERECQWCSSQCAFIENLSIDNGYVEATDYAQCQMVYNFPGGDENSNGMEPPIPGYEGPLYAGPFCRGSRKIMLSLFSDEDCTHLIPTADVSWYLVDEEMQEVKPIYDLLMRTYGGGPLSCQEEESEPPKPTSTCVALRDDSAPVPEYVVSLADRDGTYGTPPFVRANVEVEASNLDTGKPIPAEGEGGSGLLLRSVWAVPEPENRRREQEQELEQGQRQQSQRRRRGQDEKNDSDYDEAYAAEAEDYEYVYGDVQEERPYSGAEVRFAFLPNDNNDISEWWLHSSSLSEGHRQVDGGSTPTPWIGGASGNAATEIGYVSDDKDKDVLLHCEEVKFTYVDNDSGGEKTVLLRDVVMGPHDRYGGPVTCGRRVKNLCDIDDDDDSSGGGENTCTLTDGELSCKSLPEGGRASPVPGLTRREYLESYMCQLGDEDYYEYEGGNGYGNKDEHGHEDHHEDGWDEWEEDEEEWKEEEEWPEMDYWDEYGLRPMECIIDGKNELILYSFHLNGRYGSPCQRYNGTHVAPVLEFVKAYLGDEGGATPSSNGIECTKVEGEDVWVRVGCSDLSRRGLFYNSYSDSECTQGRATLEAAEFQIPFQACVRCGSRWPWQRWEEVEEEHEEHHDDHDHAGSDSNSNYNYNGEETKASSSPPLDLQCSALSQARQQSCDWKCQNALLGEEGATRDLYWEGHQAFLQASNVSAFSNGTRISFEDDFGRPEHINSGGQGEEISREDVWQEGGREQRVKFYFLPNSRDGRPYPSADIANDRGWHLYEARMYSYNGMYTDWVYWQSQGDYSGIQVPAGKQLFFCDYVEFNFFSWEQRYGANNRTQSSEQGTPEAKFVGHNVYLGAYLSGYPRYDVCSLDVYNPCENEDGTRSACRAIDGKVDCVDLKDQEDSTPSAVSARSSPPEELHCSKPRKMPAPVPATLEWKGERSYMYAKSAYANFSDGTPLGFEDRLGRAVEISSGDAGELLARQTSWADEKNGMERRLKMSFVPSSPYADSSNVAADVATWGWKMNETMLSENKFYRPGWLSSVGKMVGVPAGKQAFHCEYVEFNFVKNYYYWNDRNDAVWDHDRPRRDEGASFVAYDFVVGAYLPKDYDVCSLNVYNPCHESGGAGKVCHAVDGEVSCLDHLEQNGQIVTMRASPEQALPMCGESADITGTDTSGLPGNDASTATTPPPGDATTSTPDHDAQKTEEVFNAGYANSISLEVIAGIAALTIAVGIFL